MRFFAPPYFSLLMLPVLLILTSCLPERKVAMEFAGKPEGINIMVLAPGEIFKFNHKGEKVAGFDSLNDAQQDSALWAGSSYVQFLSDSVLLENYMNSFISELRTLGLNVYLSSSLDSFMTDQPQAYLMNIAQIQLDEYLYPLEDEEPVDDTVYYKRFDLNALDFCCWFELSKLNAARKTLLYSAHTAFDSFDGSFLIDPWTREISYKYHIDTLSVNDIYSMATYLGRKHASYLFDYFMNQYVAARLPQGENMYYYYHYNRQRKNVTPVEDDRFEILGVK